MRDLDELRHAMASETAGLRVDLPPDLIRRRARRIRSRRTALVAAGLVVALAIPAGVLAARPDPHVPDKGRPAPVCTTPGADGTVPWVGAPVEVLNSASFKGMGIHRVLVGVTYTVEKPILTMVFHHEETGLDEYGFVSTLTRTPDGAFQTGSPADGERRLVVVRANYGDVLTVVMGLYAGLTDRITYRAGTTEIDAHTSVNRETGWTLFWLSREPGGEDAAEWIDAPDDRGRVVTSVPGGPGVRVVPSPTPPPLPAFSPTC